MAKALIFRVMNGSNLFSNGGSYPSFSSKGKVWLGRGSFMNHVAQVCKPYNSKTYNKKDDSWTVVEAHMDYEAETCQYVSYKFNDLVDQLNRKRALTDKYGTEFAKVVDRIESKNQQEEYQWALILETDHTLKEAVTALPGVLKGFKLKQNTDYMRALTQYGGVVAFKSKNDALRVRLALPGKVSNVNIANYLSYDN